MKFASLPAIVLAFSQITFAQTTVTEHGTLVFVITTKDGVVTCADKRKTTEKDQSSNSTMLFSQKEVTYTDDYPKIYKINDRLMYTATGLINVKDDSNPIFLNSLGSISFSDLLNRQTTRFDIHSEVARFFAGKEYDGTNSQTMDLGRQLLTKINPLTTRLVGSEHYYSPFNLFFVYLDQNGKFICSLLKPRIADSRFEYVIDLFNLVDNEKSQVLAMGSTQIYDELRKVDSTSLPDLRTDSEVSPFILPDPPNKTDVSRFKAATFAKKLIAETNHRASELEKLYPGKKIMVSEACSCVVLNSTGMWDFTNEQESIKPPVQKPKRKHKKH
jgi:hypothetical protein